MKKACRNQHFLTIKWRGIKEFYQRGLRNHRFLWLLMRGLLKTKKFYWWNQYEVRSLPVLSFIQKKYLNLNFFKTPISSHFFILIYKKRWFFGHFTLPYQHSSSLIVTYLSLMQHHSKLFQTFRCCWNTILRKPCNSAVYSNQCWQ